MYTPKFHIEIQTVTVIGEGAFGRSIEWNPHDVIHALGVLRELASRPSTREVPAVCNPEEGSIQTWWHSGLGLPSFRPIRNKLLLFTSYPVYGNLLQWPKHSKTATLITCMAISLPTYCSHTSIFSFRGVG